MQGVDPTVSVDLTLLARLRNGDPAAAAEIANRYRPALLRYTHSLMGNEARAEEITQETLSRLSGPVLPEGSPRPWLYKIARNLCLDALRRQKASPTHAARIQTGFEAARETAGPATRAANNERGELIRKILDAMPEEYRSVLTLRHIEDLSREEIAEVLGVSDAAVKGRLARGSEYLREQLRLITGPPA